jgi:Tol biopolymer transport system component
MNNDFYIAVASGTVAVAVIALPAMVKAEDRLTPWNPPVLLDPPVNTVFAELCPSVSKDGRSMYFFSNRPNGSGGNDLWVTQRSSADAAWGPPLNVTALNTAFDDQAPWLSHDGHSLYFASSRPGGVGGLDLYVSRRVDKKDDLAWLPPKNLGAVVNSTANDISPAHFADDETDQITLYFTSNRAGGVGLDDIYSSVRYDNGTFGAPVLVPELSSPFVDRLPGIRKDGLEVLITSDRPGTHGALDLWASTRASTSTAWSPPVNLGPDINTIEIDGCARLADGSTTLYFHSTRFGGFPLFDILVSQREKNAR